MSQITSFFFFLFWLGEGNGNRLSAHRPDTRTGCLAAGSTLRDFHGFGWDQLPGQKPGRVSLSS